MRMFPYKAARLKSDIQRAACSQVGMHTPTHWARVTVCLVICKETSESACKEACSFL